VDFGALVHGPFSAQDSEDVTQDQNITSLLTSPHKVHRSNSETMQIEGKVTHEYLVLSPLGRGVTYGLRRRHGNVNGDRIVVLCLSCLDCLLSLFDLETHVEERLCTHQQAVTKMLDFCCCCCWQF